MTKTKLRWLIALGALCLAVWIAFFWSLPEKVSAVDSWDQNNLLEDVTKWNLQGDGSAARFDEDLLKVTNSAWAMYNKSLTATEEEGGVYDKYTFRVTGQLVDTDGKSAGTGLYDGGKIVFGSDSSETGVGGDFFVGINLSPAWGDYGVIEASYKGGAKGANSAYFSASGIGVLAKFPDGTEYAADATEEEKVAARNAYWGDEHTYEMTIISDSNTDMATFRLTVDGIMLWDYWDNIQLAAGEGSIDPNHCYFGFLGETGNDFVISEVVCSAIENEGTETPDPGAEPDPDAPDPAESTFRQYNNTLVESNKNLILDESMWILNYGQGYGNGDEFSVLNTGGAAFADPVAPKEEDGFRYDIKVSATFTDTNGGSVPAVGGDCEGMQILLFGDSCLDTNTIIKWEADAAQNAGHYMAIQIAPQWSEDYGVIALRRMGEDDINYIFDSFCGQDYAYDGWNQSQKAVARTIYWSMPHTYEISAVSADGNTADISIKMDGVSLTTFEGIDVSGYKFKDPGYFGLNGQSGNTVTIQEFAINDVTINIIENWERPTLDADHNLIAVRDNFVVSTPVEYPGFVHFTEENGAPVLNLDSMANVVVAATYAPAKIQDDTITMTFCAVLTEPQVFAPGGSDSRMRYASFGVSLRRFSDKDGNLNGAEANPFGSNNANGYYLAFSNGKLELMKAGKSVTDKEFLAQKSDVNYCDGVEHTLEFSAINVTGGVRLRVVIDGEVVLGYTDLSEGNSSYASGEENSKPGWAGIYYSNDLKYNVGEPGPGDQDYVKILQFGIGDRTNVKTVESIEIKARDEAGEREISGDKILISEYDNVVLYAEVTPEDAFNNGVKWSSSDVNIVSISSQGQLIGIAEGTAVITCTTENGEISARLTVEVKFRDSQDPGENPGGDAGEEPPEGGGCSGTLADNGFAGAFLFGGMILAAAIFAVKGKKNEDM